MLRAWEFALLLGWAASLIRLPRCYYYTTCKWCMESHLSSDAWPVPWLAALAAVPRVCCVRGCRALSLALCAVPLVPGLPCLLVPLVAVLCGWAVCPVSWPPGLPCVGGLCAPLCMGLPCGLCGWALFSGPLLRPSWRGFLKKAFIFALYFSGIFSLDFSPLCAGLYFFWFIFSGFREVEFFSPDFFCVEISGEFFPDLFFRIFSCPIFATVSGFLFFSRYNIHMIPGSLRRALSRS